MIDFLNYLLKGEMTDSERELAYHLTVIYGLSLLSMVVLYRLFNSGGVNKDSNASSVLDKYEEVKLPSIADTMKLIKSRRTITPKDLNGEKLSNEQVETLLDAANWAPTHKKNEPWRFTVISGREKICEYLEFLDGWYSDNRENIPEEDYGSFVNKYNGVREQWPHRLSNVIVIGMKRQAVPDKRLPEWEEICATAMAVQNIHLAATAMEVGGFWSSHTWCKHARDSAEMRQYLGLEDEDRVFGAFVIGKYDTKKVFKSKRGDWREKVEWRG